MSWSTDPARLRGAFWERLVQFSQPGRDRRARQSCRTGHQRHSTPAQFACLGRRPLSAAPLVHLGEQRLVFSLNPCERLGVLHTISSQIPARFPRPICKGYFCASPKPQAKERATWRHDPSADPGTKTEGRAARCRPVLPFGIGKKATNRTIRTIVRYYLSQAPDNSISG